jgi:integrase
VATAAGRYRVLVLTLGYCGLRWGEASALRVHNVDLDRGRLNITVAVAEVNGRVVFGTPKSHQTRWLPVPAFLLDELRQEIVGRGPDDLVFPSPQGTVLRVQNFRRGYFDRAAKEAGVAGLVPHELRHTAASLAISVGATVKSVQRMLGPRVGDADARPLGAPLPGQARRGGCATGRSGPPGGCVQNVYWDGSDALHRGGARS